jgi:hypothetical protein
LSPIGAPSETAWYTPVLGMGWLAFLGTSIGWWRERIKHQQDVRNYLSEMRLKFAQRPDLLAIVGLLREEQHAVRVNASAPVSPWDGHKLRELPAFLEPVGIQLAFDSSAPPDAYEVFAEEVLLCYRSELMWHGDGCSDTYWSDFKRFARVTESRVRRDEIARVGTCR